MDEARHEDHNENVAENCMGLLLPWPWPRAVATVVTRTTTRTPPTSSYVKELVNADLITVERQGRFLLCKMNPRTAALVRDLIR